MREERAARNQLLFRTVNEQIMSMTERFRAELSDMDLVCECADASCTGTIRLRVDEFAQLEKAGNAFLVLHGHEDGRVEDVIFQHDGYVVVRKRGHAADMVGAAEP